MAKISDKQARAIKPGDKAKQSGITGLTLKPTKVRGRGKWVLRYVSPATGKRRDTSLGIYPDVPVADALKQGRAAREMLAAGTDPIMAKQEQDAIPTFERAARERYAQLSAGFNNARHRQNWIRSLEMHAFPSIGAMTVDAITPQHLADMLRPIWLEIPDTAGRVKQRCSDVMAACWAQGHIQGNPADVVDRLLPKQPSKAEKHYPAMPWELVPAFVQDQLSGRLMGSRAALLWLILTGARSGEVRGATWSEFDLDAKLWTVPPERMKAGRRHRVPLSDAAIDLLRAQWPDKREPPADALIFPSVQGKMLSDMAVSMLLRKAGAASDTPGRTATAHGFRSSFRNWAADHHYSMDIAERALAHTIGNKVQAAYERTDRLDARIEMMQAWADHVTGNRRNVVPFKRAEEVTS